MFNIVEGILAQYCRTNAYCCRKCRLSEELVETADYPFREYSQKQCMFHCGYEKAKAACGCVPWDMMPLKVKINTHQNGIPG